MRSLATTTYMSPTHHSTARGFYLKTKVFDYWGKINIALMSNQDQLGQK